MRTGTRGDALSYVPYSDHRVSLARRDVSSGSRLTPPSQPRGPWGGDSPSPAPGAQAEPPPHGSGQEFTVHLAADELEAQRAGAAAHHGVDADELGRDGRVQQVGLHGAIIHVPLENLEKSRRRWAPQHPPKSPCPPDGQTSASVPVNQENSSGSIVPRGAQGLAAAPVLSALPRDAPCFVRTELPPLPAAALPKSPHLPHKQRGGMLSGHASMLFFFFQHCADEINFALLKARQIFPACPWVHKKNKTTRRHFP